MKLHRLLKNFASMASLRVGMAALTFASFWLLSHRLSTSLLGGYSLLMNVFFMVQTMPLLGLTMPLMRRVAAHPDEISQETSNSFYFALPVGVALCVVLILAGRLYADDSLSWAFALLGLSMLPSAWIVVAECVLIGHECTHAVAVVNLLEALGRFLGAWAAVSFGFGLSGVFCVFVLLRCAAALAYLLNKNLPRPQWQLVRSQRMQDYRRQVPTFFSIAVVTALCTRADIVLLSKLLTLHDVGIYAAAARLSDAALMVPTMAAVVIFPSQARLFESDRAGFARVLATALRWCLIGGFAIALLVIAVAPLLIATIYAPSLAASTHILQILILGATVMVIDQLLSTTMMAAHAQRTDLQSMSLGLAVLVLVLGLSAHFFGLLGASIAVPVSLIVRVLFRVYWAQHQFATAMVGGVLRILAAAAIAVGVYFAQLFESAAANLLLAWLAYALALWATRSVRGADWKSLRMLVGQWRGVQA